MNDMSDPRRKVWAHKGEAVVCINGHVICDVAQTLYYGQAHKGGNFTNWQQPQPDRKESVAEIRCNQCRGVWVRGNKRDGYQFHFANGWR